MLEWHGHHRALGGVTFTKYEDDMKIVLYKEKDTEKHEIEVYRDGDVVIGIGIDNGLYNEEGLYYNDAFETTKFNADIVCSQIPIEDMEREGATTIDSEFTKDLKLYDKKKRVFLLLTYRYHDEKTCRIEYRIASYGK